MKLDDFSLPTQSVDGGDLVEWLEERNRTQTEYPRDATIHEAFSRQAHIGPHRIASVHGEVELTYEELDRESNRLAHFLVARGIEREDFVGVFLDRSVQVPIAALGILKAGGAYVPIDSGIPHSRAAYILNESRARVVISSTGFLPVLQSLREECPELEVICCLDDGGEGFGGDDIVDRSAVTQQSAHALPEKSDPESLAYLIYTSGTSGQPKGVMVEHRSVLRLVRNTNYVDLDPGDRILQTGALAFDASTFEIWGALLAGAAVCFSDANELLSVRDLESLLQGHSVTTLFLTTGLFNLYAGLQPDVFSTLRTLLTGGEKVSVQHVNRVRQACPQLELLHVYGPTENTTFSTFFRIDKSFQHDIPIGVPIANSSAYILDDDMRPLPPGVEGELCVGGDGLARGYLNDPELTNAKFVPHPTIGGERLYRTGDMAKWLPDGNIVFVGRRDEQVKIRGFRIEPAEIEHHLRSHHDVDDAVVVVSNRSAEDKQLVAYVTGPNQLNVGDLRSLLRQRLPEYMVPLHIIRLELLPLNANGKVDRDALPEPIAQSLASGDATAAFESEVEQQMVAIWQDILNQPGLGPNDNFFEFGGHSLKATKLASQIERKLDVEVALTAVFMHPTPREMTRHLVEAAQFGIELADEPMVKMTRNSGCRPLFAFPPATGDALSFGQLAEHLADFELYGFNFIEAETRIQDYAELILQVDSDGPYLLMGYSGGGNLAFHVAHALETQHKRVACVVMFDSARNLGRIDYSAAESRQLAADYIDTDEFRPYLESAILREKVIRRVRSYYTMFSRLLDEHNIDSKIILIDAEGAIEEYRDDSGNLLSSCEMWSEVARGGFERHLGCGDHNSLLYHPNVESNVELLTQLLSRSIKDY